jgi:Aminoglycoside-2''-adenylyltransferase
LSPGNPARSLLSASDHASVLEWLMRSTHLPKDALRLFNGVEARWWVAGGWAIDLRLGRQTREHVDLDVAILRREQRAFWELLSGWDLQLGTAPDVVQPWAKRDVVPPPLHAVWCRPTPQSEWAFEILLNVQREASGFSDATTACACL